MRHLILLLLLAPVFATAQFKRSATELAKESIQDYLTSKLFKEGSYHSVAYGELTFTRHDDPKGESYIKHRFTITGADLQGKQRDTIARSYDFVFFFDKQMRVVNAARLTWD